MQQDFLAGNTVNGNCVQEMAEEINETCTEFADGVATGNNAWNCTSTHSFGNQNTNAVRNRNVWEVKK
jgi:calcineurin-like phosphoesterase